MSTKSALITITSAALLLTACANTTIYPGEKGTYSLVTTSSDQGYAEKDAKKKSEEYCTTLGKRLVVVNHKTAYHGADKNNVAVIGLVSTVLGGGGNPARSSEDYEVLMTFRCA